MIHAMLMCWFIAGGEPRVYGVPHNQAIQLAGNKGKQARAQLCRLYGGTDPVKASLATYEWIN